MKDEKPKRKQKIMKFLAISSIVISLVLSSFALYNSNQLDDLKSKNEIVDIFIPEKKSNCEFIEGEDEYDIGRNLAMKLRENNLI